MPRDTSTLTHKDLAAIIGVSETTIKSYRRKFSAFIPVYSRGKPIRFQARAADVCRLIRTCFLENLSVTEIRQRLAEAFPAAGTPFVAEHVDSLSRSVKSPGNLHYHEPDGPGLLALRGDVERLARLQEETNTRLQRLHELFADYFTLQLGRDDALTSQVQSVHQRLSEALEADGLPADASPPQVPDFPDSAAEQPEAPPREEYEAPREARPRARMVSVRNMYGDEHVYRLETYEADADSATGTVSGPASGIASEQAAQAQAPPVGPEPTEEGWNAVEPPGRLLSLPLVLRTAQGEYLGIAGRRDRNFSLADFLALLDRSYPPPRHFAGVWERRASAWRLSLEQAEVIRPERYVLEVETVETPRGNAVTLLSRFLVDGRETPVPRLHALIRRLRETL